jgi:DNA-directed RNA polymerase specialized sigma24 family protein
MGSRRERPRSFAFLLNTIEHLGGKIDLRVGAEAQEIAPRAISYGEKLLGDPAVALTLFEETVVTVSRVVGSNTPPSKPEVRDVRSYLFRAYVNRIHAEKRCRPVLDDATDKEWERYASQTDGNDPDRRILVTELLSHYGKVTQEIVRRHLEGHSWKEVERFSGVPAKAARLRYQRAIRHLRKALQARGRGP